MDDTSQHCGVPGELSASDVTDLTAMTSSHRLRHRCRNDDSMHSDTFKHSGSIAATTMSRETSRRRVDLSPSSFHLLGVFLLLLTQSSSVAGQSLSVQITVSQSGPLRVGTIVTLTCTASGQTNLVPVGTSPLTWSRNNGLPLGNSIETDSSASGNGLSTYTSKLSFPVDRTVNNQVITCSGQIGTQTGSDTWTPEVLLLPETPVISPSDVNVINAGQVYTWTCEVNGSSILAPNVYFRGNGQYLSDGSTPDTTSYLDQYSNRIYDVRVSLTRAFEGSGTFNLSCHAVHYFADNEPRVASKVLLIRSAPVVSTSNNAITTTTEGVQTTLNCQIVSAYPAVNTVTWRKDDVVLTPVTNSRLEGSTPSSPSLVIVSAVRTDSGNYNCSATNLVGTGSFSQEIQLIVRYKPEIIYTGGRVFQGNSGGSLTLPCPAVSVPNPSTIRWFRTQNGVNSFINVNTQTRYSGSSAVPGEYGLTINPLQDDDDEGSYFCQATNDVDQTDGPSVTIVVNSMPVITTPSTQVDVNEGSSATLQCIVSSVEQLNSVTWYKGTETVTIAGRLSGGSVSTPSLTISSTTRSDSGQYRCAASNSAGTSIGDLITLDVQYAPEISLPTRSVNAAPGATVQLQCPVNANPNITVITWTRLGVGTINVDSNARLFGGTPTNTALTITNVQLSDADSYTCVVTNTVRTVSSPSITLTVTTAPQVSVTPLSITLEEGTASSTLTCSVVASPAIEELYWTKDGIRLITPRAGEYSGGTIGQPSLTILSVSREDAGRYVCTAVNTVDSGQSQEATVTVTYAPTLTVPTGDVIGQRDGQVTIAAKVSAVPEVTEVYWTKDGVRINPSVPAGKYSVGPTSEPSLTIYNLNVDTDPGTYRLVAVNARGTTQSPSVTLGVSFEPTITVDPNVTGEAGTSLTIRCDVSMYPIPTSLKWYKNSIEVDVQSGRYSGGTTTTPALTIREALKIDTGIYYCVASNGINTTISDNIDVTIEYPPEVTFPQTSVQVTKGQTVTLPVDIDAVPRVTIVSWRKTSSATDIVIGGRFSGGSPSSPNLVITNVQPSDDGGYRVTATNSKGTIPSTQTIFLSVFYAPENVQVTRDSQSTLRVGNQFQLTCTASANPALTDSSFTWLRDGQQIGTGSTLTKNAEVADFGVIRCSVSNTVGSAFVDYPLVVLFAPVPNVPSPSTVTATLNSQQTLTCDMLGNPDVESYEWRKDNGPIIGTGRTLVVQIDADSDFGQYTCTAINAEGSGSLTYNVQEAPDVGASTGDSGLSTVTIVLIVVVIIVALIIIILLIIFCCLQGVCAKCGGKKKEPSKVAPTYGGPIYGGERGAGFAPAASPPKQNGKLNVDEESAPTARTPDIPSGLIISVPEKTGGRAHHLPPLEDAKEEETYYRNEKRRSRKKRKHKKREDEGALTVTEGGYDPQ